MINKAYRFKTGSASAHPRRAKSASGHWHQGDVNSMVSGDVRTRNASAPKCMPLHTESRIAHLPRSYIIMVLYRAGNASNAGVPVIVTTYADVRRVMAGLFNSGGRYVRLDQFPRMKVRRDVDPPQALREPSSDGLRERAQLHRWVLRRDE